MLPTKTWILEVKPLDINRRADPNVHNINFNVSLSMTSLGSLLYIGRKYLQLVHFIDTPFGIAESLVPLYEVFFPLSWRAIKLMNKGALQMTLMHKIDAY
jgi:hypothetical protein